MQFSRIFTTRSFDNTDILSIKEMIMKTTQKQFNFTHDFLRVRDFLSETFGIYQRSVNWRIERWEYAFYFVAPMLAHWGEPSPTLESAEKAISFLESLTCLWETDSGEIAGVVTIEHPDLTHPGFGEFFIQRHPDHLDLFPEMLDFAETNLRDPGQNRLFIYIEADDRPLRELLEERGFIAIPEKIRFESELTPSKFSVPQTPCLPEGFRVQSMADDNDLTKRCKAFGRGFNHEVPLEWPSLISYKYLQKAPDYHKEQDIVILAPDGEFASFCLIWYDAPNHIAMLEPVGTQPEFRRMGLAREAVYEAIRRVANKGARRIVGADLQFYQSIGFVPTEKLIRFQKNYT